MSLSLPSLHLDHFVFEIVNSLISDSLEDAKSRCIESSESDVLIDELKLRVIRARQEVDTAEQNLLKKKENLTKLKLKLESETIKLVSNLESNESESCRKECLNEVLCLIKQF